MRDRFDRNVFDLQAMNSKEQSKKKIRSTVILLKNEERALLIFPRNILASGPSPLRAPCKSEPGRPPPPTRPALVSLVKKL